MKTPEALKIAAEFSARSRELQKSATDNAARFPSRGAKRLRGRFLENAKAHKRLADSLDQLRADHRLLRSELTKVRGMLAYVLDGLRADRVDLDGGNKDVRHMRQQLKVAAHILKVTKP